VAILGKRVALMFGVALALVPFLLFTYLGLHNRLLIDDYLHLGLAREVGTWKAMLFFRETWNGDYSNFLLYGLLAHFGTAAPPLFALFLCATAFVGFSWLINSMLASLRVCAHRRAIIVVLAALTTAATINGFYHAQVFYWLTAAVEYTWPAVMLLLGIALAAATARRLRGNLQHILAAIATTLYAFANAGFSEMYLVFQLTSVALIAVSVLVFQAGPKRNSYIVIVIAGLLGTIASLPMQLASPGFTYRSLQSEVFGYLVLPVRDLPILIDRTLEATLQYAGHEPSFAGFMLVAFAGLFLTLSIDNHRLKDSESQRIPDISAPIAFALIVQLIFIPILWSHRSDNPLVFSRFSYAFTALVGINLLAIAVLLALLWRRDRLNQAVNRRNGLMIYCSAVLLAACCLFMITQVRSIHYKASSHLFFTAVSLLIMLGGQLALIADPPRLRRLFLLSAFATASAVITLLALIAVKLWGVGYIIDRTLTSVTFALMLAGLLTGVALGALIHRGFWTTNADAVWFNGIRLFCLLVAFTIAAGMVIAHGQRISHARKDAEIWEATHQEIIRLRDEGDPSVYTKNFTRLIHDHLGHTPSSYRSTPLLWHQKLYYGLDLCDNTDECRCPKEKSDSVTIRIGAACLVNGNSGRG